MMHQLVGSKFNYAFVIQYNTYIFGVLLLFISPSRKRKRREKKMHDLETTYGCSSVFVEKEKKIMYNIKR